MSRYYGVVPCLMQSFCQSLDITEPQVRLFRPIFRLLLVLSIRIVYNKEYFVPRIKCLKYFSLRVFINLISSLSFFTALSISWLIVLDIRGVFIIRQSHHNRNDSVFFFDVHVSQKYWGTGIWNLRYLAAPMLHNYAFYYIWHHGMC